MRAVRGTGRERLESVGSEAAPRPASGPERPRDRVGLNWALHSPPIVRCARLDGLYPFPVGGDWSEPVTYSRPLCALSGLWRTRLCFLESDVPPEQVAPLSSDATSS